MTIDSHEYCRICLELLDSSFCENIVGYDPDLGFPIVTISEDQWAYIYNQTDRHSNTDHSKNMSNK